MYSTNVYNGMKYNKWKHDEWNNLCVFQYEIKKHSSSILYEHCIGKVVDNCNNPVCYGLDFPQCDEPQISITELPESTTELFDITTNIPELTEG